VALLAGPVPGWLGPPPHWQAAAIHQALLHLLLQVQQLLQLRGTICTRSLSHTHSCLLLVVVVVLLLLLLLLL
jgi:hypothetical protein